MKATKVYTHYTVWHRPDYNTAAIRWGTYDTMQEAKAAVEQLRAPAHYPEHILTIEKTMVYVI